MRFRTCATLALFALIAIPGSLRAQDDAAVTARYEAALEWWNWIRDGEFEKAGEQLHELAIAQGGMPHSWSRPWPRSPPKSVT